MLQPGRKYSGGSGYRYGFNGKENDKDVTGDGNQYDYGFRIYNPRIGKFLSVDPLTPKYPELTPFQFASNRPIDGIDEDGLEYISTKDENITSAEKNKDGSYNLKIGDLSISASSVVSHNGQDYYNLGKILYKDENKVSDQSSSKSTKLTCFFVTENQLKSIFPKGNPNSLSTLSTMLNKSMEEYGIDNYKVLAHFLAQCGVETGGFETLNATENLDYTLKNVCDIIAPNDQLVRDNARYSQPLVHNPKAIGDKRYEGGYNFRGRGILQLTHLGNYKTFQKHYNSKYSAAIDIVTHPDLVQTNTELAVLSGLHYFNYRVINPYGKFKSGVNLSSTTDTSVDQVTFRVNGGYIQQQARRNTFKRALENLY